MGYSIGKIKNVFATGLAEQDFVERMQGLNLNVNKAVDIEDLPRIGEQIGFLPKINKPLCMSVFITKGGVLKTTLTLNIARLAALHNVRTIVVGLDMQGDVTQALGLDLENEAAETGNLDSALSQINLIQGLNDLYTFRSDLKGLIRETDLPTLQYIPETPELVLLTQQLQLRNRREYWLKEHVIDPLKTTYDLVILDCSPNWSLLTTNALLGSDVLLSPVECKINNFRNVKIFQAFIRDFQRDFMSNLQHYYVPTRYSPQRRLSQEILGWYQANLPHCLSPAIKEGISGEESSALHMSVVEYAPKTAAAQEMRELLTDLFKNFSPIKTEQNETRLSPT